MYKNLRVRSKYDFFPSRFVGHFNIETETREILVTMLEVGV